ncbi:hypothetical protein [Halioxenophilus aromaticivorans]
MVYSIDPQPYQGFYRHKAKKPVLANGGHRLMSSGNLRLSVPVRRSVTD